ncbi:hypothetical protein J2S14_003128 [Lederbergia wuyishanensis]|uniref:DUF4044 domain-containing protein n=1 Tax=Lederbergia wuyishanensis TaxID=1347903 RepID=A0ABU0D7A0_9BACI|nr:hypothetical protein [Lederbergia wuyishanensis]
MKRAKIKEFIHFLIYLVVAVFLFGTITLLVVFMFIHS